AHLGQLQFGGAPVTEHPPEHVAAGGRRPRPVLCPRVSPVPRRQRPPGPPLPRRTAPRAPLLRSAPMTGRPGLPSRFSDSRPSVRSCYLALVPSSCEHGDPRTTA